MCSEFCEGGEGLLLFYKLNRYVFFITLLCDCKHCTFWLVDICGFILETHKLDS